MIPNSGYLLLKYLTNWLFPSSNATTSANREINPLQTPAVWISKGLWLPFHAWRPAKVLHGPSSTSKNCQRDGSIPHNFFVAPPCPQTSQGNPRPLLCSTICPRTLSIFFSSLLRMSLALNISPSTPQWVRTLHGSFFLCHRSPKRTSWPLQVHNPAKQRKNGLCKSMTLENDANDSSTTITTQKTLPTTCFPLRRPQFSRYGTRPTSKTHDLAREPTALLPQLLSLYKEFPWLSYPPWICKKKGMFGPSQHHNKLSLPLEPYKRRDRPA